jgi:hypothetical protein
VAGGKRFKKGSGLKNETYFFLNRLFGFAFGALRIEVAVPRIQDTHPWFKKGLSLQSEIGRASGASHK